MITPLLKSICLCFEIAVSGRGISSLIFGLFSCFLLAGLKYFTALYSLSSSVLKISRSSEPDPLDLLFLTRLSGGVITFFLRLVFLGVSYRLIAGFFSFSHRAAEAFMVFLIALIAQKPFVHLSSRVAEKYLHHSNQVIHIHISFYRD